MNNIKRVCWFSNSSVNGVIQPYQIFTAHHIVVANSLTTKFSKLRLIRDNKIWDQLVHMPTI